MSLSRPAGERPEATGAVLDHLGRLAVHIEAGESLTRRIDNMQAVVATFRAEVHALAARLGEPPLEDVFEAAAQLGLRRQRALDAVSASKQAAESLDRARDTLTEAGQGVQQARAALDGVIAAAGAADEAGAEQRIGAARAAAQHRAAQAKALAEILAQGGGAAPASLAAESAALGDAAAALAEAEAEAERAGQVMEQAILSEKELAVAATAAEQATDAVQAEMDREAAAARYATLLEHQLVLHLAGSLLRQAMQDVEGQTGGSALARASSLFGAVTDGAYALEDVEGTLKAVERRYPHEHKGLMELSEGTRDQLYLSLRIGALQDQAALGAPLPFVADDILQTFDDGRAVATMRALLALSDTVQVIVLTHHEHLIRLASALPAGRVNLVRLASAGPWPSV